MRTFDQQRIEVVKRLYTALKERSSRSIEFNADLERFLKDSVPNSFLHWFQHGNAVDDFLANLNLEVGNTVMLDQGRENTIHMSDEFAALYCFAQCRGTCNVAGSSPTAVPSGTLRTLFDRVWH